MDTKTSKPFAVREPPPGYSESKRVQEMLQNGNTQQPPSDLNEKIQAVKGILEHESSEDIALVLAQCSYDPEKAIELLLEGGRV